MFVLFAMGLEIAVSLGVVGVLGLLWLKGWTVGLGVVGSVAWSNATSFSFIAVPLFVFMSAILLHSGIGRGLFTAVARWVGFLPGGLAVASVFSCAIFAAVSGSSVATAATIGMIAIPEMEQRGYGRPLICGSLAAGGTLGILIPPSIPMIIYGVMTETSVGHLYMAGPQPRLPGDRADDVDGRAHHHLRVHLLARHGAHRRAQCALRHRRRPGAAEVGALHADLRLPPAHRLRARGAVGDDHHPADPLPAGHGPRLRSGVVRGHHGRLARDRLHHAAGRAEPFRDPGAAAGPQRPADHARHDAVRRPDDSARRAALPRPGPGALAAAADAGEVNYPAARIVTAEWRSTCRP